MHDLIFENQSDLDFLIYEEERLSYETVYHHVSALAAALFCGGCVRSGVLRRECGCGRLRCARSGVLCRERECVGVEPLRRG